MVEYDGTMAVIPSQISYGGCQKTLHGFHSTILVQKAHNLAPGALKQIMKSCTSYPTRPVWIGLFELIY